MNFAISKHPGYNEILSLFISTKLSESLSKKQGFRNFLAFFWKMFGNFISTHNIVITDAKYSFNILFKMLNIKCIPYSPY